MISKRIISGTKGIFLVLLVLLFVTAVALLINDMLSTRDHYVPNPKPKKSNDEEVTTRSKLTPVLVMTPEDNRRVIRAIETSSKTYLSYRQACSLESAAKFNPDMDVVLYMLSMDESTSRSEIVRNLLSYENFKIERITTSDLFRDTELEKWYEGMMRRLSPFQVEHLSDAMRYALIYKKGGIYMDLDVYFVKSLNFSENFITLTLDDIFVHLVESYLFGFSKPKHPILVSALATFESTYNPFHYGVVGPELFWNKAESYCLGEEIPFASTVSFVPKMLLKRDCDVKVLLTNSSIWNDFSLFIPFYKVPDNIKDFKTSHVHLKNKASSWLPVRKSLQSPFIALMASSCPKIFSIIPDSEDFK